MSGYQNSEPKIPDLGTGILRPPKDPKEKSPQFRGLVNCNGQIMSISIWYMQPSMNNRGQQMPASFSVKATPYVPNAQPAGAPAAYNQQPQMQYGAPPQQPQYAPQQQQYAPPQQQYAPQQPAPQAQRGYQPAPQATQPPPYQPPQNGAYGAPAPQQQAPANGGYGNGYSNGGRGGVAPDEIPF